MLLTPRVLKPKKTCRGHAERLLTTLASKYFVLAATAMVGVIQTDTADQDWPRLTASRTLIKQAGNEKCSGLSMKAVAVSAPFF